MDTEAEFNKLIQWCIETLFLVFLYFTIRYVEFLNSSIDLSKTKLKTVYINPTATNSVKIVKFHFYICGTLYVSYSLYQQHFNFLIYKMLK